MLLHGLRGRDMETNDPLDLTCLCICEDEDDTIEVSMNMMQFIMHSASEEQSFLNIYYLWRTSLFLLHSPLQNKEKMSNVIDIIYSHLFFI